MTGSIIIAGGGPSGLAAALLFLKRGAHHITLIERRASPQDFDKNKGFNYLLDARGQRLIAHLGLTPQLADYGVPNDRNQMTLVKPDGSQTMFRSPFWDPSRDAAVWMRRHELQAMLFAAIEARSQGRVRLLYGHGVQGVETDANGAAALIVADGEGATQRLTGDLLLGCDGLNSVVRAALANEAGAPAGAFEMQAWPSPSTGLAYKVFSLPARIPFRHGGAEADDHRMAYAFFSRYTEPDRAFALVSYPTPKPGNPRTFNIIRYADHQVWTQQTGEAVLRFLQDGLPQIDIRALLTREEAEDFAATRPGQFPAPQFSPQVHGTFGTGAGRLPCVLIGDAAHAFPPDLGLGVNSALEDLLILDGHLDAALAIADVQEPRNAYTVAIAAHDADQQPEREALVRLVQTVAPYQYNQDPKKLKQWALKFFAVKALHTALPWLIDMPAVLLAQQDALRYSEIRRRQLRNQRVLKGFATVGLLILLGLVWLLI